MDEQHTAARRHEGRALTKDMHAWEETMGKMFTQRMLLLTWVCACVLAAIAYPNQPTNLSQSGSPAAAMDGLCKGQLVGELFARTELFFGSSKPDGSVVTMDVAKAIGSVYGADTEKAFLPLWRKHIGFTVDYNLGVATKNKA